MRKKPSILKLQEGEEKQLFEKISQAPHQISNYRRLARLINRRKRPKEAICVLKMLLKRPPEGFREEKEIKKQMARIYEDTGDFPQATRLYRALIRQYPRDFVPYERLQRIYKEQGKKREIIKLFKAVKGGNPLRERALKRLVALHKELGEIKSARRYLITLIKRFGPDFSRLKELGRLHEKCGHLRLATQSYKKAQKLRPDHPDITLIIGVCQRKAGYRKKARRTFKEALKIKPGFYGGHIHLAEMDIEEGEFKEAESHLNKLDARWPGNSRVKINRAHILLKQGEAQKALELARETLPATPFYYTDELSLGFTVLAGCFQALGEEEEANFYDLLAARIRGSSDFFRTAIELTDEFISNSQLERAEKVTDFLLKKFPGNSLASLKKAEVCRLKGDWEQAVLLAQRASRESKPRYLNDKIMGLKLMSELYEEKGLHDKARESREFALQLSGK